MMKIANMKNLSTFSYRFFNPFVRRVVTAGLVEEALEIRRLPLAARPELHAFVEHREPWVVLAGQGVVIQ